MLYYALINPYFDYCNIVWGIERNVHLENLFKLQKKAVRMITWSKWNSHSSPIFKKLNIFNLFDINILSCPCMFIMGSLTIILSWYVYNVKPSYYLVLVCL